MRVLTWNLYHGRDGLPGLGPTRRSTWRGIPEDDGTFLHVNRKLTGLMARRLARWAPDLCALQEVPAAAVEAIAATTGMQAVLTTTGPLVGPSRLRDALAAANPDLWRGHEANANVILIGSALRAAGPPRSVRLNPVGRIARDALELRLTAGELAHYLPEPRRAVIVPVRPAGGGPAIVVGCVHCHNARDPRLTGREIARAAAAVRSDAGDGPAVLAGDLNAPPAHPALAGLAAAGWDGADAAPDIGIDRILVRGLVVVDRPRRLDPAERDAGVWWRARRRRVRLSDHDPVVATLALPGGAR